MTLRNNKYKSDDLFGKSTQNLRQLPVRFEETTLEEIERISELHGISKARVVRKLVNTGLEQVKQQ